MKENFKMKKYLSFLIITLFVLGSIFAQDTKISANGVTVPNWMVNCAILKSETGWGTQKTIGQILGKPNEATKLKKVVVDGNNLHLEYYVGEKPSEAVLELIMDFVCARLGDTGTAYCSHVKLFSRLTFEEGEASCDGPKNAYKFGECLGMLHASVELMFIDEEKVAREKALEEERKKEEEKRLAEEKKQAYWSSLKIAILDREILPAVTLSCFEGASFFQKSVSIKNIDANMEKLGFKKGDLIRGFEGTRFYSGPDAEYFCKTLQDELSALFGRSEVIYDEFHKHYSEIDKAATVTFTFYIERRGKSVNITTPALNPEQLKSFNEKFETDWEASHQKK